MLDMLNSSQVLDLLSDHHQQKQLLSSLVFCHQKYHVNIQKGSRQKETLNYSTLHSPPPNLKKYHQII